MKYGKLNGTALVLAPTRIKVGGKIIAFPKSDDYKKAGYLPVDPTHDPPEGYKWTDQWKEQEDKIVKKYVEIPQEEQDEMSRMAILSGDEAEAYYHMEETIQTAQNAAEEARQEAEAARADAAAAVEAKEVAEAALADTADIIAKIEEVFG